MQTQTNSAFSSSSIFDGAGDADDPDQLMALVNQCVEALQLMQARIAVVEERARKTTDSVAWDRSETRSDITTLRTRVKLAESGIDQVFMRLAACEAGAQEAAGRHEREFAAARIDAQAWRKKAEADLLRLNHLESWLGQVETSLAQRLDHSESSLMAASAEIASLRVRAETGEEAASSSGQQLAQANSAIADQRARIACLQAKLNIANETIRLGVDKAGLVLTAAVTEQSIIDLGLPAERRISAA